MPNVSTEKLTPITMPGVQTRLTVEEENELLRVLREAKPFNPNTSPKPSVTAHWTTKAGSNRRALQLIESFPLLQKRLPLRF